MNRATNTGSYSVPNATIQIVHIEGARKGEIENFLPGTITFGRNPNCDVVFPRDAVTVSRLHAKIVTKGKKFVLTNLGTNGCYVNGKMQSETALHAGDVITFAEDGPKVSFIYDRNRSRTRPVEIDSDETLIEAPETIIQTTPKQFTLQYQNQLSSFEKNIVSIGHHPDNDFPIDHPRLLEHHAEFFFIGEECFVRNPTDVKLILVNGELADNDRLLKIGDVIELNSNGPAFEYLGEGKFREYLVGQSDGTQSADGSAKISATLSLPKTRSQHRSVSLWARLKNALSGH